MYYLLFLFLPFLLQGAQPLAPVRIHYSGGGDWYGNKTTWVNILKQVNKTHSLEVAGHEAEYKITDPEFLLYPMAYISGHGNIRFSDEEVVILRNYLSSGGFLFADDDYGMDVSFRREMKRVFPALDFVELPFDHPVYHIGTHFNNGLPKVHEHDGGAPKGFGLILNNRLICFYSFNTDLSDGCEDADIHQDPPAVRKAALDMAVNIFLYGLLN